MPDNDLVISDEVKQKFPELLALIIGSQSMNNDERQYWINILPVMTPEQHKTLEEILTNEKNQLAAIDEKYKKNPAAADQVARAKEYGNARQSKRDELKSKEHEFEKTDTSQEQEVLKKIQEL